MVIGQILISHIFRQFIVTRKSTKSVFFEQAFVGFFFPMGAMHNCIALQSKSSADHLHGHVFALLLNTLLIINISVSREYIWDSKLSGSCLGISLSLSFGPTGQFSGLIFKFPISLCGFCLLSTGYYGNTEWGGDSTEMSVAGYLEPWCPLSSFSLGIILLDLWIDKCAFIRCIPLKRNFTHHHSVVEMRLIKRKFQKSSSYSACIFLSIHIRWWVMVACRRKSLYI